MTRVQTEVMKSTRARRGFRNEAAESFEGARGKFTKRRSRNADECQHGTYNTIVPAGRIGGPAVRSATAKERLDVTKTAGAKTEKGKSRERCLPRAFHHSRRATRRNAYAPRAKPDVVPARVIRAR